jgi:hypothetical protein
MIVLAFLFPERKFLIWACMVAAAIPDIVWWFYRKTVKEWPGGLDRFTTLHFKINDLSHTGHAYYDILWFLVAWIVIIFKL